MWCSTYPSEFMLQLQLQLLTSHISLLIHTVKLKTDKYL